MKKYLIIAVILFGFASANAEIISNPKVLKSIEKQLPVQRKILGSHYSEYEQLLNIKCNSDEKSAFKFILAYSPLSDLADYSADFLLANTKNALETKQLTAWGASIPEEIFLHFVLPVRVNNENLDSFRLKMRDSLLYRVRGLSLYDAALELNHWCHERVTYRGSDARTSSPLATIRTSWGRCGEESTLLVATLRAAGIPARQVYTPRWAHCDDNHAWVEVWVDGKWYFMGACEPSPALNMGWFAGPATRTMLVNTRAFGAYFGSEDVITRGARFSELNVISNYQPAKEIKIKVTDKKNKPVKGAKVEFLLYNYAEFFTLASVYTDAKGTCNFKTGNGDLLIRASKSGKFNMQKLAAKETELSIKISKNPKFSQTEFELTPPTLGKIIEVNTQDEKRNAERLLEEDSLRAIYTDSFLDSAEANEIVNFLNFGDDRIHDLIVNSYGNFQEILDFMKHGANMNCKTQAVDLLSVINPKDLRDSRISVLMDHLKGAMQYYDDYSDKDLWRNYVLNGRIQIEMMTDWRSIGNNVLNEWLHVSPKIFAKSNRKIDYLIRATKMLKIDSIANAHSRAPLTPNGVYRLKCADPVSRDIFFVALCRSLGIAARLNSGTGIPQYFEKNAWHDVSFQTKTASTQRYGFVHFENKSSFEPKYYSNFTIGRVLGATIRTIDYDDIMLLSKMDEKIEVPAGKYILTTGNRDIDGKVYVGVQFFDVAANQTSNVAVAVRDIPKADSKWATLNTADFAISRLGMQETEKLGNICNGKPFIIAIIEPDKEPTKHVMADFIANPAVFDSWSGNLIFLLETKNTRSDFSKKVFDGIPDKSIFAWDVYGKILSTIGELRKEDNLLNEMPIIIFGNSTGDLHYFSKGYRIGTVNDLEKLIK